MVKKALKELQKNGGGASAEALVLWCGKVLWRGQKWGKPTGWLDHVSYIIYMLYIYVCNIIYIIYI